MSSILHQNIRRICRPLLVHPVIGHQGFRLRPEAGAVVQLYFGTLGQFSIGVDTHGPARG